MVLISIFLVDKTCNQGCYFTVVFYVEPRYTIYQYSSHISVLLPAKPLLCDNILVNINILMRSITLMLRCLCVQASLNRMFPMAIMQFTTFINNKAKLNLTQTPGVI